MSNNNNNNNNNNNQETKVSTPEIDDLMCALKSAYSAIVFSVRDWSLEKCDAWVYGIIVGWDSEALIELQEKFKWDNETVSRLREYHSVVDRMCSIEK